MHAWSQEPQLRSGLPGIRRMTASAAVRRTVDDVGAPLGGYRMRILSGGTGSLRSVGVMDEAAAIPTDAVLMARVAAGDEQAFAAVYDRHAQSLHGAVMRYLGDHAAAEDVVQETFLAMWTRSESYSPEAGSLIGWLLTIARHRAIDRLRATSRQPMVVGFGPATPDGPENDLERLLALGQPVAFAETTDEPSYFAERRWVRAVVRTALDEMPEAERRALELAYDQELTQAEIAERLGWPLGTVKTRTRRALLRLRAMLESVPDIAPPSGLAPAGLNGRVSKEGQHGPR